MDFCVVCHPERSERSPGKRHPEHVLCAKDLFVIARSVSDEAIHVHIMVYIMDRHGRLRDLAMTLRVSSQ